MHKLHLMLVWVCITACNSTQNKKPETIIEKKVVAAAVSSNKEDVLNSFQSLLFDQPQTFIVPAQKIKTITAKKGLRITVDPSKLETIDGVAINADIEVTVKEMQKPEEMIANNCATVSDGRLLSSGGSYYIGMTCAGKEVRIKKGTSLTTEFPKIYNKEMELFYGERTTEGMMNWKKANIALNAAEIITVKKDTNDVEVTSRWRRSSYDLRTVNTNIDATKSYRESIRWLKAFEDSVIEKRKKYVAGNYDKISQNYIRDYMQLPMKMGRRDIARLRMTFTPWPYKKNTKIHLTEGLAYYLVESNMADTMMYYTDSIKFAPGEIKPAPVIAKSEAAIQPAYEPYNNIQNDIDVDISPVETTKDGSVKKTVVRYYDPVGITNLGWINCDRFYETEYVPQYTFEIKGDVPDNIGVYAIFRNINAVMAHKIRTKGKASFVMNEKMPLNAKVEFLVYSKVGKDFVESKYTAKVTKDMTVPVVFNKVPEENVKKAFLN